MIGISSDGDERLLNAMKSRIKLDLTPTSDLSQYLNLGPINVQDSTHIGTKLRNRLLNTSISLQMGNMMVTATHIEMLLSLPKHIHGLVFNDIRPDDRQNFSSYLKITDPRVIDAIKNNVVDSNGTVKFLESCKQITSSYLGNHLKPTERIYLIWNALYFIRCWRSFIQSKNNDFTISEHFISQNAYSCIEINAHALIYLILRLRTNHQFDFFIPHLFSSQPCEETFRRMRSMGTANFTKINFTLFELLHMIARVEMMNKIIYSQEDIPCVKISSE